MVKLPYNFFRLWLSARPSENGITLLGGAFSTHSESPCCFWIGGKSLLNTHPLCRLFILILELGVAERVSEMSQVNPLQDSSLGSLEPSLTLVFWLPEAPKICWSFIVLVMEENPRKQALCFCGLFLGSPLLIFIKMQVFTEAQGVYVYVNLIQKYDDRTWNQRISFWLLWSLESRLFGRILFLWLDLVKEKKHI